jgi:hypothetical protein
MLQLKPIAAILILLSTLLSAVAENAYLEDFSTHQFNDAGQTTAHWDTLAGELKLLEFEPDFIWQYGTSQDLRAFAVSGDLAVGVTAASNFDVFDISNLTLPIKISSDDFGANLYDVAFVGNYAYVAAGNAGLKIVDLTDPTLPVVASTYNSPGSARGVALRGNHVYLGDGNSGLHIIDVSEPTSPVVLGSYDTSGFAYRLDVEGDLAYLADGLEGLKVIDITDPSSPSLLSAYDTPGTALAVDMEGNLAYVADLDGHLRIIDVSDPTLPNLIAIYPITYDVFNVTVEGDKAYLPAGETGLSIVDVSNPSLPSVIFLHPTPGVSYDVVIEGEYAFLADDNGGLRIVNVQKITSPELLGSANSGYSEDLEFAGNIAYIAARGNGVEVYDVSDVASPVSIGATVTALDAWGLDVEGDLLYVADGVDGVRVFDVSDPASPTQIGHYDVGGSATAVDVEVEADRAYVSYFSDGLVILDVEDPSNPVGVGELDLGEEISSVALAWPHAYLSGNLGGVYIVDVRNPSIPLVVGTYDTPYYAVDIALAGDHAYVADYSGDLLVLDISDPSAPAMVADLSMTGSTNGIEVSGNFAFLANWNGDLAIVDISDPSLPTLLFTYYTSGYVLDLALFGENLGLVTSSGDFEIIEVFQDEVQFEQAFGQSLNVDGVADDVIARVRLSSAETSGVDWEISAFGTSYWGPIPSNLSWTRLVLPGSNLAWRANLNYDGEINPTVTSLGLQWLNDFAPITSISDLPDDQGGRVALRITRSGFDFADESEFLIHNYNVWLRLDDALLRDSVLAESELLEDWGDGTTLRSFEGHEYLLRGEGDRGSMPPGLWASAGGFTALQQDEYGFVAETLADSTDSGTNWNVFCVTAHTDSPVEWYASYPDSGYSVDNLAPNVPSGFLVDHDPYGISNLNWEEHEAEDFRYFRIYRGETADFEIGPEVLVHETVGTNWIDEAGGVNFFYKITALDFAGNESDPATPDEVVDVDEAPPVALTLHANVPNPFNPKTEIRFELPTAGNAQLSVYDVTGRAIRELASEHLDAGVHVYTWDGRNDGGQPMASGIYFSVLSAEGRDLRQKMVLLK